MKSSDDELGSLTKIELAKAYFSRVPTTLGAFAVCSGIVHFVFGDSLLGAPSWAWGLMAGIADCVCGLAAMHSVLGRLHFVAMDRIERSRH